MRRPPWEAAPLLPGLHPELGRAAGTGDSRAVTAADRVPRLHLHSRSGDSPFIPILQMEKSRPAGSCGHGGAGIPVGSESKIGRSGVGGGKRRMTKCLGIARFTF